MNRKFPIFVLAVLLIGLGGLGLFFNNRLATHHTVLRVTGKDERLQEAAKVAQATLPKFLSRLAHPERGDQFAIKVRFKTKVGPEYLWLKNPQQNGERFKATLDQVPIAYPAHKGDLLNCQRRDIYDWLIRRKDGSMAGGFTEIALGG